MLPFGLLVLTAIRVVLATNRASLLRFWVALEFSSFFIIPLLNSSTLARKEVMWEYFLIQAVGRMGFLASSSASVSVIALVGVKGMQVFSWRTVSLMFLLLKLGIPPFHGWTLRVVEAMSWEQVAIFSVLAKMPPLLGVWALLPSIQYSLEVFLLFSLAFSFKGILERSLRRVIVYSSIINVAWVMAGMSLGPALSAWLFFSYALRVSGIVLSVPKGVSQLRGLFRLCFPLTPHALRLLFLIMNIVGIPPTLGFFAKLNVLKGVFSETVRAVIFLIYLFSISFVLVYFWFLCFLQIRRKRVFRLSNLSCHSTLAIKLAIITFLATFFQLL